MTSKIPSNDLGLSALLYPAQTVANGLPVDYGEGLNSSELLTMDFVSSDSDLISSEAILGSSGDALLGADTESFDGSDNSPTIRPYAIPLDSFLTSSATATLNNSDSSWQL